MREILGWALEQWLAAGAAERDFYTAVYHHADDALARLIAAQEKWRLSHVFDPLQSPIVIPDSYRARP